MKVHLPQESIVSPTGLAEATIKDTTLTLPEGVQASAGASDGLLACSAAQFGFNGSEHGLPESAQTENDHFTPGAIECPEAAKIGTVSVKTPLLEHELKGAAYIASENTDPFGSPLVLYALVEDPVSGVRVKLAGEIHIDQATGQLTTTLDETPPLAFEDLTFHLFDGPRASQATPERCGTYTSTAAFKLWSREEPVTASSSFNITSGPHGTACPAAGPLPFTPSMQAGSTNNQAGAYSPFTLTVERADGQQGVTGVTSTLPEGLAAKLSSVTPCPEPPVGQPWSCGADSLIGKATTSSGLGTDPVTLTGQAYLTTGYDGAPFGLLVSTLAKAGPFNLGLVNVRSRINVNDTTAAVTVTTDPGPRGESLPTILKGVPVQLKALNVTIDRPEFQFNPTSCAPLSVTGTLTGDEGTSAPVSSPFEVTNCASLPFAPKLTATAGSQASKVDGASLNVKIESPGLGQANIQKVLLTIPSLLPSRLDTIQKACPDYVFEKNPASCDEGSVVGKATVHTPVLKNPLIGPAYLVSHANREFPDVDFVLQGEGITLIVTGHTNITHGVTYSRFETAPDAPFTAFETELPTGPHSALTAYVPGAKRYDLCGQNVNIPTEIIAQDGAEISQDTPVALTGCPPAVKVVKTKAKKTSVLMSVSLSAAGTVTITGKGLKSTTKKNLTAGSHSITVPLTRAGIALYRANRKLAATVKLSAAGAVVATTASFR